MARTSRRKISKIQPAQRTMSYVVPPGESYIDLASGLSAVNRRAYRQGMQYAVTGIDFQFNGKPASADFIVVAAYTAGSTWVVHNSWKKAQAHWLQQQRRARKLVGQSAMPAYEDFKVYLDDAHRVGTILPALASDGGVASPGEWVYSRFVFEADDNSIQEWDLHIIGGDVSTTDKGLILAYQESRATVQAIDPSLPAEYSANMYSYMAGDLDLVADEVAANMEDENDQPPYDHDDYPGNDINADAPWLQAWDTSSAGHPGGAVPGFVAQCGLIKILNQGYTAAGAEAAAPPLRILVHIAPGKYKGVLAEPMGQ